MEAGTDDSLETDDDDVSNSDKRNNEVKDFIDRGNTSGNDTENDTYSDIVSVLGRDKGYTMKYTPLPDRVLEDKA